MLSRVRVLAVKAGKAVVLSTHILPDVQTICDTVVIVAKGRVRIVERLEVLTRPVSPAYRVRVFGSAAALAERIRRAGMDAQPGPDDTLTLATADEDVVRRVWDWAREAGVGIRTLLPDQNSLEQIFLDAVREDRGAAS